MDDKRERGTNYEGGPTDDEVSLSLEIDRPSQDYSRERETDKGSIEKEERGITIDV